MPGVAADVRDAAAVTQPRSQAAEELGGPPDVLVNAAGVYRIGPADELDDDEWDEVLDTNLRGSFLVAREFVRIRRLDATILRGRRDRQHRLDRGAGRRRRASPLPTTTRARPASWP